MHKKHYYMQGVDEIHQLVETPASKEKTEQNRFVINTVISIVSAISATAGLIISILAYLK